MNRLFALVTLVWALLAALPAGAINLSTQIDAIPPGEWRPVSTEVTMASIDPAKVPALNSNFPGNPAYHGTTGFKALFSAWNSGAFSPTTGPCGSILYMGGGHLDYWGNLVVALDLCGASDGGPTWRRITSPWVAPITFPIPFGQWPDGTPSPHHTYDGLVTGAGKLMLFTTMSQPTPVKVPYGFMLDVASGVWTPLGVSKGADQGISAWDSKRNVAWFAPGGANADWLTKFDPATKVFTELGKAPTGTARLDGSMGYDPVNDLLVSASFRYTTKLITEYDITANKWTRAVQVNMPAVSGQHAMQWSAQRQAWIIWMDIRNDGRVWEVKRSLVAGVPTYTWSLITAPTNTLIPTTATHVGVYDKFQLVTVNGHEVLIGTVNMTTGVWAFKLPSTVVADACEQDGVIVCDRFEGEPLAGTIVRASSKLTTPWVADGVLNMEVIKKEGTIGAVDTGHYRVRLPSIGEGQMLAFAYSKRLDDVTMKFTGAKDLIVWGPHWAASCAVQQFAMTHMYDTQVPIIYQSCGKGIKTDLADGDKVWQNGDFDCRYRDAKANRLAQCHTKKANKWARYYTEIHAGKSGQPDSRVIVHVKTDDGWRKMMDFPVTLPSAVPLEIMMLTGYYTNGTPVTSGGRIAFDDFIVSTKPLDLALL